MAETTASPVFSSPSYWVALGAGVVGIAAAAMQERKGSGSAAYRPYTSYGGDPYWMNAKYAGTDAKGLAFKKGERVFYYPKTKTIYAGANAETAYHDFRSMAEDEDFMGGGGSYNEGSAARGVTEAYVEEYLDGDNIAISTFLNRRLRGKAKSYAGQYARRLKAALDAMVVSGDAYRDTTPNGAVSYRRTGSGSAARVSDDRAYREAFNQAVDMANRLQRDVGLLRNAFGGYSVYLFTEAERDSHRGQVVRPGEPKMGTGSRAMSGRQS